MSQIQILSKLTIHKTELMLPQTFNNKLEFPVLMLYLKAESLKPSVEDGGLRFRIPFEPEFKKSDSRLAKTSCLFLAIRSTVAYSWHVKLDRGRSSWQQLVISFSLRPVTSRT
jgi:hypothetical protein